VSWTDVLIFVAAMALIALALRLVQWFVPHPHRERHNEVAGFIFAGVGVLYAVLLGFVVVSVWGNVAAAQQTTFNEANSLAGVYWISRSPPLPPGPRDTHVTPHHPTTDATPPGPPAATLQQQVLYDHAVTDVESLASARRERLNMVQDAVPPILWVALITGAVLTIGFTFLFGLSNSVAHGLMVLALGALVVASLILIKEMDYPFGGVTKVDPTAFQVFLSRLPPPR